MLKVLKTNRFLRAAFQGALRNVVAFRNYPDSRLKISFPAARHLSLFFSRLAVVEPVITENLRRLTGPRDVVYDVGANIGYFTLLFGLWAANGKVIAVEPDPNNRTFLESNIRMNGLDKIIKIIPAAVSDKNGYSEFFLDLNTGRTSSISPDVFHPSGIHGLKRTEVPTITCDAMGEAEGFPAVIKCDVEGHEAAFLRGAGKTLDRKPVLMIEVQEANRDEVGGLLLSRGYRLFDAEKPFTAESECMDHIMAENILAIHEETLTRNVFQYHLS